MINTIYSHIVITTPDGNTRKDEGYLYSDINLAIIHAMAPCTVVQHYTDGSVSNPVLFKAKADHENH